jgi:hypothetical protein
MADNDYFSLFSQPAGTPGLLGDFDGPANLGMSLLANAGPSPVRMPLGAILGKSGLEAQQNALRMALMRAQVAQEQQRVAFGSAALGFAGSGQPGASGAPGQGAPQQNASPTAPPGAPPFTGTPAQSQTPGAVPQQGASDSAPQQRDPYAPVTQDDIAGTVVPGVMPLNRQVGYSLYVGKDPSGVIDAYRKQQIEVVKQQHAADVARLDNLIRSDHPASYAASDDAFMARWPQLAKNMGVDPRTGWNDPNVRRALGMVRNPLAASVGVPTIEVPEQGQTVQGDYGQQLYIDPVTHKPSEVSPQKPPGFSVEKSSDAYGNVTGVPVQTSGFTRDGRPAFSGNGNASSAASASNASGGNGRGIPLGVDHPNEENVKMAAFASLSGPSLAKVRELEGRGVALTPQERTLLLNAITDDSQGVPGAIQKYVTQLALTKMPADKQTYISAMIPFLQGTAHEFAGARLPLNAIRANLESVVPLDLGNAEHMGVVNTTRDSYLKGMDVGSGSAGTAPEFAGSIGARRKQAAADAQLPVLTPDQVRDQKVPKGTRFRTSDGRVLVKQ